VCPYTDKENCDCVSKCSYCNKCTKGSQYHRSCFNKDESIVLQCDETLPDEPTEEEITESIQNDKKEPISADYLLDDMCTPSTSAFDKIKKLRASKVVSGIGHQDTFFDLIERRVEDIKGGAKFYYHEFILLRDYLPILQIFGLDYIEPDETENDRYNDEMTVFAHGTFCSNYSGRIFCDDCGTNNVKRSPIFILGKSPTAFMDLVKEYPAYSFCHVCRIFLHDTKSIFALSPSDEDRAEYYTFKEHEKNCDDYRNGFSIKATVQHLDGGFIYLYVRNIICNIKRTKCDDEDCPHPKWRKINYDSDSSFADEEPQE